MMITKPRVDVPLLLKPFILLCFIVLILLLLNPMPAQAQPPADTCADLEYLLQRDITPYDLSLGGGALLSSASGTIPVGHYADFWSFNIERAVDEVSGITLNTQLNLRFSDVTGTPLEFALYRGMNELLAFTPVEDGAVDILLRQNGAYTLVVRRVHIADANSGSYAVAINAENGAIAAPTTGELREAVANIPIDQPAIDAGRMAFSLREGQTQVTAHPDSILRVNLRQSQSAQVFFPSSDFANSSAFTMHLGDWAEQMTFLAGDFAARGTDRVYYLEGFDFTTRLDGISESQLALQDVTYADGTAIRLDWQQISGVWMLAECVGFKLRDGRAFTAAIAPDDRRLSAEPTADTEAENGLDDFEILLNALDSAGANVPHRLRLSWQGVRPDATVRLRDGVFHLPYVQERELRLQSSNLELFNQPPLDDRPGATDASLLDQQVTFVLDWFNLGFVGLEADTLTLTFLDAPRGTTTRDGANLRLLEALDDVVRIVYKETAGGLAGEQRLLLPRSESYLEIITPAGEPPFDPAALPGAAGYFPRALNNTGAECYPSNTVLPVANCPPNGHPNPANGNLWLSITDLTAAGDLLDLSLTRSYNSRYAAVDSPFGRGWITPYLLDFPVAYDTDTHSRPVTPAIFSDYVMSLDVSWGPRGIVTLITPSGSRHQFVSQESAYVSGVLRAVTMPGWTLEREGIRAPIWRMTQDDGFTFEFDRAGRLLRYGYPDFGRMIQIDYPRDTLNGAAELGETRAVLITDAPTMRRLELYFDDAQHIVRAVLRDLSGLDIAGIDTSQCQPESNCFETRYTYDDDLLVQVDYPDGQSARYEYTEGLLTRHDDPRAPIAPTMTYAYDENGGFLSAAIQTENGDIGWRGLVVESSDEDERIAALTDELGNTQSYTYAIEAGDLRQPLTTFALTEITSPLAGGDDPFEDRPTGYTWANGLLVGINARPLNEGQGRNGIDFVYTPHGQIACIACNVRGLPELRVEYNTPLEVEAEFYNPTQVQYADGSSETFTYDTRRRVVAYGDRDGAAYRLSWDDNGALTTIRRTNDDVTWNYRYNAAGLVTQITQTYADTEPYIVRYEYDGLGRLTAVQDSILGRYSVDYPLPLTDSNGNFQREMTLTDPLGTVITSRYDHLDRLIERRTGDAAGYLQRTTYGYDDFNRLLNETRWLAAEDEDTPLTTSYTYEPQASLTLDDGTEVILRGERTIVTDPYGRSTTYVYDALHRLRRTIEPGQVISDYTYDISDTDGNRFGLRIEQNTRIAGTEIREDATYLFDLRRQLRAVQSGAREWNITALGDTTRQRSLTASLNQQTVGLAQALWADELGGDYVQGLPQGVNLRFGGLSLEGDFNVMENHRPSKAVQYDFLGRPLQMTTNGHTQPVVYCPAAAGGTRVLYGQINAEGLTCESQDFQQALTYDAVNRLIAADDASGTRTIHYQADGGHWLAEVSFSDQNGAAFNWELRYNSLGQRIAWRDETGTLTHYRYDTLGRLAAVMVPDMPEASFTYRYNAADLLVESVDGLGRGFSYSYDALGRVTSQLNLRTADAFSYAYSPAGMLSTQISPLGNTYTYRYEDPTDPTRLTGITQPTGNRTSFTWDDAENTLIYRNAADLETRYVYDGAGLLWQIVDPLRVAGDRNRTHELYYDDAGRLTDWREAVSPELEPDTAYHLRLAHRPNTIHLTEGSGQIEWGRTLQFSAVGQLNGVDDLRFQYDPLGRLNQINANEEQIWSLLWDTSEPQVTLGKDDTLLDIFRYDALFRRLSDATLDYDYRPGERGNVTLTLTHPTLGAREWVFSPGNARLGTSPTVTLLAQGQRVIYTYNAEGLLVAIATETCSRPQVTTIEACENTEGAEIWRTTASVRYDALLRPVQITDENGDFETFAYDDLGNLVSYQNANRRVFNYGYDAGNRLNSLTSATGVQLLLRRNPGDQLTGVCRARAERGFSYPQCVASGGELMTYAYDALARLTSRRDPTSEPLNYTYNPDDGGFLSGYGDVTLAYDALGRLANQSSGGENAAFSYDDFNRLLSVGMLDYAYDDSGSLNASGAFTYGYDAAGYSITGANDFEMGYALDERGFLQSLTVNGVPQVIADYPVQSGIDFVWANGTVISQQVDFQREPTGLLYIGSGGMTIFQTIDPEGLPRRQSVTQPGISDGYVVIYSYDSDERPITMRITDTAGLSVLFTQSFTYDELGQRVGESRRYADETQVIIQRDYADDNRLLRQIISIIRPLDASASAAGFALFFAGMLAFWRKRKWAAFSACLLLALIIALVNPLAAQQTQQTFTLDYAYDSAGNLTAITHAEDGRTCRQLEYDGLNRLTRLVLNTTPPVTRSFSYDAFNRLQAAGDAQLVYQGADFLGFEAGDAFYSYGQTANQPAFFVTNAAGDLTWLLTDGRERIVQVVPAGDATPGQLWLFDPLERYLSLVSPSSELDPCAFDRGLPDDIPDAVQIQPLLDGRLWDTGSGLYFVEGRAYDPAVGAFLQPDPAGVDVVGGMYTQPTAIPYPAESAPTTQRGVLVLRDALETIRINDRLTAHAVLAQHPLVLADSESALWQAMQAAQQPLHHTLDRLLKLPTWLETAYNLPAAYRDPHTGTLRLPLSLQERVDGDTPSLPADWLGAMERVPSTVEQFGAFLTLDDRYSRQSYRSDDAQSWTASPITAADIRITPQPAYQPHAPNRVLDWLPRTLTMPEAAVAVLDAVEMLKQMPQTANYQWIDAALAAALPATPESLPRSLAALRDAYFGINVLDVRRAVPGHQPQLPAVPAQFIGANPDWLHLLPE